MTRQHRTPLQAHAAARAAARTRSRQLAGELTRLGVRAEAAPGGDRAGIWLDGSDAELAIAVLRRSAAQGEITTRDHFGLPPAAAVGEEFTPDPEYRPDLVSGQMLSDALAAYSAQPDGRRGMIAAMAAAGLGDEVTDRGLLDTAEAVFAHEVFVKGLGGWKGMTEALVTVLARVPPPAGFADDGERSGAGRAELEEDSARRWTSTCHPGGARRAMIAVLTLDECPACGVTQLGWSQAGCTHPYHRTGDGVVLSPAGSEASAAAFPDIVVDEPAATTSAERREQLIRLVTGALHGDIRVSHEQVRQFQAEAGSFTWYRKTLAAARRWVTVRSPGEAGLPEAPVTGDPAGHDQRIHDTRGDIQVTCPRGCGQLIWPGGHSGPGGCGAGNGS